MIHFTISCHKNECIKLHTVGYLQYEVPGTVPAAVRRTNKTSKSTVLILHIRGASTKIFLNNLKMSIPIWV